MPKEQKGLDDEHWETLLDRIKTHKCTPFIGAGACLGRFRMAEIAARWADENEYPLNNPEDLVGVAQFLAIVRDPVTPKERIAKQLKSIPPPNFRAPDEPHGVLADLHLPVYMTTNYDDFMIQAIKSRYMDPKQEICRWNESLLKLVPSIFDSQTAFEPTPANPVVFHFYGHIGIPESLVLAEDEYLDFLVNISRDESLIPRRIQRALSGTSLLFLGYQLADRTFRVLLRTLSNYLGKMGFSHVSVQLVGENISKGQKKEAQDYLNRYFGSLQIYVYWGTCQEFIADLRERTMGGLQR